MTTTIWVTSRFEGVHRWEGATQLRKRKGGVNPATSSYLQYPHRHVFCVRVEIRVLAADREIEFHLLLRAVELYCRKTFVWPKVGVLPHSCETMAQILFGYVHRAVTENVVSVEVSEDGECGAIVRG